MPRDKNLFPLHIGKDLDGCDYLFDAAWHAAMVKLGRIRTPDFRADHDAYYDYKAPHHYRPAATWEFYETYGFNLGEFIASCHEAADAGLLWQGQPLPGAADAWKELAKAGHLIHVKTDRSFGTHPMVSEVATRIWLNQHGLEFESITFGPDKTAGPRVDIMLEDKLSNYDALDAAGVEVWLIDRSWNQDNGARRRVYSHEEFATRVRAMEDRRYLARQVEQLAATS